MAGWSTTIHLASIEAYVLAVSGIPRNLEPDELDVLRDGVESMVSEIEDVWPRDTGTSRDGWHYSLDADGGIGFEIINEVDYAEWVYPGDGDTTPLVDWLPDQAIDNHLPGLLTALRAAIDATQAAQVAARQPLPTRRRRATGAR